MCVLCYSCFYIKILQKNAKLCSIFTFIQIFGAAWFLPTTLCNISIFLISRKVFYPKNSIENCKKIQFPAYSHFIQLLCDIMTQYYTAARRESICSIPTIVLRHNHLGSTANLSSFTLSQSDADTLRRTNKSLLAERLRPKRD